jgi:hypothetical protein
MKKALCLIGTGLLMQHGRGGRACSLQVEFTAKDLARFAA